MARERDYRAEYRARVARAEARGVSGQARYGKASREARAASGRAERAAARLGFGATTLPNGQRVFSLRSESSAALLGALQLAANEGARVALTVSFDGVERDLSGRGLGIAGNDEAPIDRVENRGDGRRLLDGPAQLTAGPAGTFDPGKSVPATDVLDYLSDYDDPYDGLYDWWDAEDY